MKRFSSLFSWTHFIAFTLCIFVTCYSLFHFDFFRPHDYTHAVRIVEMNRSLKDGEVPVRWSRNFGFGYGMPLFNFYAPLPYYIAQIPYLLTGNVIVSIKFLYLLNAVLAFIGMVCLGKMIWSKEGGLISAIVFSFSTYRALDLYVRGALGEVTAMVLLPFALIGVVMIAKGRWKTGTLLTSLSLAGVLLSHNLIGLISVGIVFGFGLCSLYIFQRREEKKNWIGMFFLTIATLLGVTLSSFYTLPAFFEKNFTRVESTITSGDFDYHKHFVAVAQLFSGKWGYGGSVADLYDGMSFSFGRFPLLLLSVAVITIFLNGKKEQRLVLVVSALFFVGTTLMTLTKSVVIWEQIELLKFFQFPWRFLTFSHVFLALTSGGIVMVVPKSKKRWGEGVVLGVLAVLIVAQGRYFTPERFYTGYELDSFYTTDEAFIRSQLSQVLNDYIPPQIVGQNYPAVSNKRMDLKEGNGSVEIVEDQSISVIGKLRCKDNCLFGVNIFHFPGWTFYLDGKEILLPIDEQATYFLSLPKGAYELEGKLENTSIRTIGNTLSLVTGFVIVSSYMFFSRKDFSK